MPDSRSKEKQRLRRIYEREVTLIKEGKDPEVAHAVAVAEETVKDLKEYDAKHHSFSQNQT